MTSQITSLMIVYASIYSGADEINHQSSAFLAFVRGIHRWSANFPHKGPTLRKMSPFDDVIITETCHVSYMGKQCILLSAWRSILVVSCSVQLLITCILPTGGIAGSTLSIKGTVVSPISIALQELLPCTWTSGIEKRAFWMTQMALNHWWQYLVANFTLTGMDIFCRVFGLLFRMCKPWCMVSVMVDFELLGPAQNGLNKMAAFSRRHSQLHHVDWKCILIQMPLMFVIKVPIDNKSSLVQVLAWH